MWVVDSTNNGTTMVRANHAFTRPAYGAQAVQVVGPCLSADCLGGAGQDAQAEA